MILNYRSPKQITFAVDNFFFFPKSLRIGLSLYGVTVDKRSHYNTFCCRQNLCQSNRGRSTGEVYYNSLHCPQSNNPYTSSYLYVVAENLTKTVVSVCLRYIVPSLIDSRQFGRSFVCSNPPSDRHYHFIHPLLLNLSLTCQLQDYVLSRFTFCGPFVRPRCRMEETPYLYLRTVDQFSTRYQDGDKRYNRRFPQYRRRPYERPSNLRELM